jgi:hypothetical protein
MSIVRSRWTIAGLAGAGMPASRSVAKNDDAPVWVSTATSRPLYSAPTPWPGRLLK